MDAASDSKPRWRTALGRGWRRQCPHCGRGMLYERWNTLREQCPACGMQLLRNQGDPWGFLLIVDRVFFIAPVIAGVYFGVLAGGWLVLAGFFLAVTALVLYTTPHRYGLCIALDYLTRVYWRDPADTLPVLPDAPVESIPMRQNARHLR